MEFKKTNAREWRATDKDDTYDIIEGNAGKERIFACFKNRTIYFATQKTLTGAIEACVLEKRNQQWQTNNKDCQARYAANVLRRKREAAEAKVKVPAELKPKAPKLYEGTKDVSGEK